MNFNQPQTPSAAVDNRLARFLKSLRRWNNPAILASEDTKAVYTPYAKTGTVTDCVLTEYGIGVKGDGTTGYYGRTISEVAGISWLACSFVANTSTTAIKSAYGLGSSGVSGAYLMITGGTSTLNNIYCGVRLTDSSANTQTVTGPAVTVGAVYNVVFVLPTGLVADSYIYVNGIKYTATGLDMSLSGTSTLVNETVGCLKRSTVSNYSSDTILLTARGKGAIPEVLAREISLNPWVLYAKPSSDLITLALLPSSSSSATAALNLTTDSSILSGTAQVSPTILLSVNSADSMFSGSALVSPTVVISLNAANSGFSGTANVSPTVSAVLTTGNSIFSGTASVSPIISATLSTGSSVFSGSAFASSDATVALALNTGNVIFNGIASVSPTAILSIGTANSVLSGSALVSPTALVSLNTDNAALSGSILVSPIAAAGVNTANSVVSGTTTGYVVALSLTSADLSAIADAVWAHTSASLVETRLLETWGRLGLDPAKPLVTGTTSITFGQIVMAMTEANNTVTVTRQ